jgi:hypothetical protein
VLDRLGDPVSGCLDVDGWLNAQDRLDFDGWLDVHGWPKMGSTSTADPTVQPTAPRGIPRRPV